MKFEKLVKEILPQSNNRLKILKSENRYVVVLDDTLVLFSFKDNIVNSISLLENLITSYNRSFIIKLGCLIGCEIDNAEDAIKKYKKWTLFEEVLKGAEEYEND